MNTKRKKNKTLGRWLSKKEILLLKHDVLSSNPQYACKRYLKTENMGTIYYYLLHVYVQGRGRGSVREHICACMSGRVCGVIESVCMSV